MTRSAVESDLLRRRFGRFLKGRHGWSVALNELVGRLDERRWVSFLFGGTLRDLASTGVVPPRDLDVVVDVQSVDLLEDEFRAFVVRRNRFGGLRLQISALPVDIWPLSATWAFREGVFSSAEFAELPRTTFLNVEAVVAELTTPRRGGRRVFERGFFDAFRSGVLEINLRENPFPLLCVVRSVLTARSLGFRIGPKLAEYIVENSDASDTAFDAVQISHYGHVRISAGDIRIFVQLLNELRSDDPVAIPGLTTWGHQLPLIGTRY